MRGRHHREERRDAPLSVGFTIGAGRVVFTTFHQEPSSDPEIEKLLRLLVFEL